MSASAYKAIYSAIVSKLTRTGVSVGRTAGYPRIEVHSITENERMDKGGSVRVLSLTVESMTTSSLVAADTLNTGNLTLLATLNGTVAGTAWRIIGILPTQLQDLTETSDTKRIIYRLLQGLDIYVEAQ